MPRPFTLRTEAAIVSLVEANIRHKIHPQTEDVISVVVDGYRRAMRGQCDLDQIRHQYLLCVDSLIDGDMSLEPTAADDLVAVRAAYQHCESQIAQ